MRTQLTIAAAVSALLLVGATQAQTPAVGDAPAATVGRDYSIARQRDMSWERGTTTGYAARRAPPVTAERWLPERFAPDAEQSAPAGH